MKPKKVLDMLADTVSELKSNHQWGTAHVYQSAANSFTLYIKGNDIPFARLTPAMLKDYEAHLRRRGCSWNTVATYMKVLKAVYNRAIDRGQAAFVPRLFRHVRTAPCNERKKALDAYEMGCILKRDAAAGAGNPGQVLPETARQYFVLMFLLRGIPFVDIAYLKHNDIRDGMLYYRRKKTGKPLCVALTEEAKVLIERLKCRNRSGSSYLFPFLQSPEGSEEAYREYQMALRRFNRSLKELPGYLGFKQLRLSSYAARHTWATMAYHCEVHPGIISEAMGHSSIAVTEVYLKPFRNEKIDLANRRVIDFVKHIAS